MKKITLAILLISLLASCEGKTKDSYRYFNLKGNVKSVITNFFEPEEKFGEITKSGEPTEIETLIFSKTGKVTENSLAKKDGTFFFKYTNRYDKNDFIEERISYESDGLTVKERENQKFDSKGQLIESKVFNKKGDLIRKNKSDYQNGERILVIDNFDKDGNLIGKEKITKSSSNLITSLVVYDGEGVQTFGIERMYDDNDKLIFEKTKQNNGDAESSRYTYDKKGFVIKKIVTSSYSWQDNEEELTYKYEFDAIIGNWITQIEFKNEKPEKIIEREIEYYD